MTIPRRLRPSRQPPARDMDASPFAVILGELLSRVPGAYACALVDQEGETVDYTGTLDPFDVKIAAAHLRILLSQIASYGALGEPRWMTIRGVTKSIVGRLLPEGYALVVVLRRRAGFARSERAYLVCERALAAEAGWSHTPGKPVWHPVIVELDARGRPRRVGTEAPTLEVLGAVVGLGARERGFRVRLATGKEVTVVREPGNHWYADDRVE